MRKLMDWTGRILASMKLGRWGARLALLAGILLVPVPGQAVTGVTWTPQTSGTTNNISGITWSGTQFVAVGDTWYSGTILTSSSFQ